MSVIPDEPFQKCILSPSKFSNCNRSTPPSGHGHNSRPIPSIMPDCPNCDGTLLTRKPACFVSLNHGVKSSRPGFPNASSNGRKASFSKLTGSIDPSRADCHGGRVISAEPRGVEGIADPTDSAFAFAGGCTGCSAD